MSQDIEFRVAREGTTDGSDCVEEVRAFYKKRIAELEAELAALDWTPITESNLPKVGDEVGVA